MRQRYTKRVRSRQRTSPRWPRLLCTCAAVGGCAAVAGGPPAPTLASTPGLPALQRRAALALFGAAIQGIRPQAALALVGSAISPDMEALVKTDGGSIGDFAKTSSGLRILDLTVGKGEECCSEGEGVVVDWSLRRGNGYFVDASFGFDQARGIDERFGVGTTPDIRFVPRGAEKGDNVIEGLREAVLGMRVGGTRRVIVPPKLGYVSDDLQPMPTDWGRRRQIQRFRNQDFVVEVRLKAVRQ